MSGATRVFNVALPDAALYHTMGNQPYDKNAFPVTGKKTDVAPQYNAFIKRYAPVSGQQSFTGKTVIPTFTVPVYQSYSQLQDKIGTINQQSKDKFRPSNHLSLYPQWAIKIQKPKVASINQIISNQATTHQSPMLSNLQNALGIQWSTANQSWVGQSIRKAKQAELKALQSKFVAAKRSSKILDTSASIQQINQQVPLLIRQILMANQALVTTGIGPKSRHGLKLYAGRIIDPKTGRITLLPKASMQLVNPVSLQQKKAYLQAKLINTWNSYLQDAERYDRLNAMDPQTYYQTKATQIYEGLQRGTDQQTFSSLTRLHKRIQDLYVKYLAGVLPSTSPYRLVLQAMILGNILTQGNVFIKNQASMTEKAIKDKYIELFDSISASIKDVTNQCIEMLTQVIKNPQKLMAQKVRVISAAASLDWKSIARKQGSIKNAVKALTIPDDMTQEQTKVAFEGLKTLKQNLVQTKISSGKIQKGIAKLTDAFKENILDKPLLQAQVVPNPKPTVLNYLKRDAKLDELGVKPYFDKKRVRQPRFEYGTRPIYQQDVVIHDPTRNEALTWPITKAAQQVRAEYKNSLGQSRKNRQQRAKRVANAKQQSQRIRLNAEAQMQKLRQQQAQALAAQEAQDLQDQQSRQQTERIRKQEEYKKKQQERMKNDPMYKGLPNLKMKSGSGGVEPMQRGEIEAEKEMQLQA